MELRVWVDGTQRVVCGVKLTTTCQEIVFALAHATQQAGRFTMIERWRNNERLLSPNEQPLVTLQRWGEHMNEVEFILKKTSTDLPVNPSVNQLPQQQRTIQQAPQMRTNHDESNQQVVSSNGRRDSPSSLLPPASNKQIFNEQQFDGAYHHHQFNLNRRPQTIIGPLTSSNSSLSLGNDYLHSSQQSLTRLPNSFRASLSTSTLPNTTNSMTASPSNTASLVGSHYAEEQIINNNPSLVTRQTHNGYPVHNETQLQPKITNLSQCEQTQVSKNYPFEDLYSTINKKRTNQPPAIPAKPRVVGPIAPVANLPLPHHQMQPVNNAQMNYYHPHSLNMYSNNFRPRNPPGYLDYMEAMANRNSLPQPILSNPTYAQQCQTAQGNFFQRSFDTQPMYNMQRIGSSPVETPSTSNKYHYSQNGQSNQVNYDQNNDMKGVPGVQNFNPVRPKLIDSGLVINRGSAVNVRLPPSIQSLASHNMNANDRGESSSQRKTSYTDPSVSQMGHDMLKVIQEQKKVLMNQKNELDRLDNDQEEYWETKQNSEQTELIIRIENEIRQLEELWKENQNQIKKLENQDFEKELQELKSEQVKMELEIGKQREKLSRCEKEIIQCKSQIDKLEAQLVDHESDSDTSLSSSESQQNPFKTKISKDSMRQDDESFDSVRLGIHTNGSIEIENHLNRDAKSSEDEDYDDDSGGDASDDLNLSNSDSKLRSAKDVAYVDKRGLISGIRSLKLDKSRNMNRQLETIRSAESLVSLSNASTVPSKDKASTTSHDDENRCPETNGQYPEKTANNNNKYEFLMTL